MYAACSVRVILIQRSRYDTRMRGLSEIVLVVRDLDQSRAFYTDILGLEEERSDGQRWAWFRLAGDLHSDNDSTQYLALTIGPLLFEEHSPRTDLPSTRRLAGPIHFALCASQEDVEHTTEAAQRTGAEIHGPVAMEWMNAESRYLYDPDGNLVELWTPVK